MNIKKKPLLGISKGFIIISVDLPNVNSFQWNRT